MFIVEFAINGEPDTVFETHQEACEMLTQYYGHWDGVDYVEQGGEYAVTVHGVVAARVIG